MSSYKSWSMLTDHVKCFTGKSLVSLDLFHNASNFWWNVKSKSTPPTFTDLIKSWVLVHFWSAELNRYNHWTLTIDLQQIHLFVSQVKTQNKKSDITFFASKWEFESLHKKKKEGNQQ